MIVAAFHIQRDVISRNDVTHNVAENSTRTDDSAHDLAAFFIFRIDVIVAGCSTEFTLPLLQYEILVDAVSFVITQ